MVTVNLINPPAVELYDPKAYPNLGLLYLGAVLKKAGYECIYVDLADCYVKVVGGWLDIISEADFHLITVLQATYKSALAVRNCIDNGEVYVGGIQATIEPEKTFRDFQPEAVVTGEAENRIVEILDNGLEGIVNCGVVNNLDDLPFPDRDLIPREQLRNFSGIHLDRYDNDGASTTMISSRGCPYNCKFCCRIPQTRYFRWRSAKNIVDEMKEIWEKYGINHLRFVDDCFTANKKRVFDLCSLLKDEKFYWLCITRADSVNEMLLRSMYKAGLREIHFGVESGSQRILNEMWKEETVEQYVKAVKTAKEVGLKVKIFLMEGFPTETEEDVELTKKFIEEVQPDKWTLSKFTPLAGSGMSWNGEYGQFFYPEESELKEWLRSEVWRKK